MSFLVIFTTTRYATRKDSGALLEKELDLTKVTLALAEIDAFTAAITTRKAAL